MKSDSRFFVDVYNLKSSSVTTNNFIEVVCNETGKSVMPPLFLLHISEDPKTLYFAILRVMRDHITHTIFDEVQLN